MKNFEQTTKDMCSRCRSRYFYRLPVKEKERLIEEVSKRYTGRD